MLISLWGTEIQKVKYAFKKSHITNCVWAFIKKKTAFQLRFEFFYVFFKGDNSKALFDFIIRKVEDKEQWNL